MGGNILVNAMAPVTHRLGLQGLGVPLTGHCKGSIGVAVRV